MRLAKFVPILLFAVVLCVGCGPKKPDGVPSLFPTTVTIVKSGTPVANANVIFVAGEGTASGSWSVSGITDATGVAKIETSQGDWKAPGAPEGEYKFYITKLAQIEEPEQPADIETNEEAKKNYFAERLKRLEEASKEIPKSLTSTDTSDLSITVASGTGGAETVDVDQYK